MVLDKVVTSGSYRVNQSVYPITFSNIQENTRTGYGDYGQYTVTYDRKNFIGNTITRSIWIKMDASGIHTDSGNIAF